MALERSDPNGRRLFNHSNYKKTASQQYVSFKKKGKCHSITTLSSALKEKSLKLIVLWMAVEKQAGSQMAPFGPGFLLNAKTMTNCVGEE